jgi:hypothetical protein
VPAAGRVVGAELLVMGRLVPKDRLEINMRIFYCVIVLAFGTLPTLQAFSAEDSAKSHKPSDLRLFDTSVFGKRTTDAIVLLKPERVGTLNPETVMVDIEKEQYYAATVRYPKEMSFEAARQSLNRAYGKWEKQTFAKDPTMGIWRNEDDKFSIQLTEDGFTLVVIYIKFSMVSDRNLNRGFSRATKLIGEEDQAQKTVAEMRALLDKGEFEALYRNYCHKLLREQVNESKFKDAMRSHRGKEVAQLITTVDDALKQNKGRDVLIAQHNERDSEEYEFILVQLQRRADENRQWHLKLRKEEGKWKLKELD